MLLPQRCLFTTFLYYSLNSHSFTPFFQWWRGNKILVYTLFPKKGELIFGRVRKFGTHMTLCKSKCSVQCTPSMLFSLFVSYTISATRFYFCNIPVKLVSRYVDPWSFVPTPFGPRWHARTSHRPSPPVDRPRRSFLWSESSPIIKRASCCFLSINSSALILFLIAKVINGFSHAFA